MRARSFTHTSIHAYDLEASARFYEDLFGLERVPAPDFGLPVIWLRLGDLQLHLFERETPAPEYHHIGIDVDDFEGFYLKAKELGLLDGEAWGFEVRELASGELQMYVRDPAGNLVEINHPDVSQIDRSVVTDLRRLVDVIPQTGAAAEARLYMQPRELAR